MKIFYSGIPRETAERAYAAYLLGRPPREGAMTLAGPLLRITAEHSDVFFKTMKPLTLHGGGTLYTVLPSATAARALRAFSEWRRLPTGLAATITREGLFLYKEENILSARDEKTLTFPDLLNDVLADKEIEARRGIALKTIRADCETGIFSYSEARRTSGGWLLTRAAAERRYEKKNTEESLISPLLLVYATTEAAVLWNRGAEDIRSAAAGAGHRAARLGDGERRRAGKLWLVTRDAMEMLYGNPVPEKWRAFIQPYEK